MSQNSTRVSCNKEATRGGQFTPVISQQRSREVDLSAEFFTLKHVTEGVRFVSRKILSSSSYDTNTVK